MSLHTTASATSVSRFARPVGVATVAAGIVIVGLGAVYVARPPTDAPGPTWLVLAAIAAFLVVAGLAAVPLTSGWARVALRLGMVGMVLFGAGHLVALANGDLGVLLFSVFALVTGVTLTVAGIGLVRSGAWTGWRRWTLLACGLLPISAIPVGAAIGDTPHFSAIAAWGLCWVLLGIAVLTGSDTSA